MRVISCYFNGISCYLHLLLALPVPAYLAVPTYLFLYTSTHIPPPLLVYLYCLHLPNAIHVPHVSINICYVYPKTTMQRGKVRACGTYYAERQGESVWHL